jgi:hypothetical protein
MRAELRQTLRMMFLDVTDEFLADVAAQVPRFRGVNLPALGLNSGVPSLKDTVNGMRFDAITRRINVNSQPDAIVQTKRHPSPASGTPDLFSLTGQKLNGWNLFLPDHSWDSWSAEDWCSSRLLKRSSVRPWMPDWNWFDCYCSRSKPLPQEAELELFFS